MRPEHDLLERYSGSIPRYTSYPSAAELREVGREHGIRDAYYRELRSSRDLRVYVHLPYCKSLCYFCACNKIITKDAGRRGQYLRHLEIEADLVAKRLGERSAIRAVHLGGGSPSYFSVPEITSALSMLENLLPFSRDAALTIELDPRTTSEELIELVLRREFRRASLGVQDFDERVQTRVNRVQSFELVSGIVARLRAREGLIINFDLIYGLPLQTLESLDETLRKVGSLRPDRIAFYGYAHIGGKHKAQKSFRAHELPNPAARLELLHAKQYFESQGYLMLGMDHFALPHDPLSESVRSGSMRRGFMGYTEDAESDVLGLGLSAISDIGGVLMQNAVHEEAYFTELRGGELPLARGLARSDDDRVRSAIIEQLMCPRPADLSPWGDLFSSVLPALHTLENDGLIELTNGIVRVTSLGRFFIRNIASVFDCYLKGQGDTPRSFSQAI